MGNGSRNRGPPFFRRERRLCRAAGHGGNSYRRRIRSPRAGRSGPAGKRRCGENPKLAGGNGGHDGGAFGLPGKGACGGARGEHAQSGGTRREKTLRDGPCSAGRRRNAAGNFLFHGTPGGKPGNLDSKFRLPVQSLERRRNRSPPGGRSRQSPVPGSPAGRQTV